MADGKNGGGWFSYGEGQPNPHLTTEQRDAIEKLDAELADRRGAQVARVVIDVYESGEAVPQVQLLGATISAEEAARAVNQAAAALASWR